MNRADNKQLDIDVTPAAFAGKPGLVALLAVLSWVGAYIHITLELQLPVWRPENSLPALIGLLLFLGWWRDPRRHKLWTWLLLGWTAGGHLLIGAILSVLPLPLWPFYPEQAIAHYFSHIIYGVTQLPLIWILWKGIKEK